MAGYTYGAPLSAFSQSSPYYNLALAMMGRGMNPQVTMGGFGGLAQGAAGLVSALAGRQMMDNLANDDATRSNALISALSNNGASLPPGLDSTKVNALVGALGGDTVANKLLDYSFSPHNDDLVKTVDESGNEVWTPKSQAAGHRAGLPQAPTTKDFYEGGSVIQKQWNPQTSQWDMLDRAPRWEGPQAPQLSAEATVYDPSALNGRGAQVYAGGPLKGQIARPGSETGLTAAQQASNADVDSARQYIDSLGIGFDDLLKRTQAATETGMPNPDFDPYLSSVYRRAMRHKVGGDEDYDSFAGKYRSGGSQPGGSQPGSPAGQSNLYGAGSSEDNPLGAMTPEQASKLPPGTWFKTTDGRTVRRSAQ